MVCVFGLHNDRSENNFDYSIHSHQLRREKYYLLSKKILQQKGLRNRKKGYSRSTQKGEKMKLYHFLRDPVTRITLLLNSEVPTTAKCQRLNRLMQTAWHFTPLVEGMMHCLSISHTTFCRCCIALANSPCDVLTQ